MSDDSKEPKVEFDRSLYEFFSKAEKVAEAKKEEEENASHSCYYWMGTLSSPLHSLPRLDI